MKERSAYVAAQDVVYSPILVLILVFYFQPQQDLKELKPR